MENNTGKSTVAKLKRGEYFCLKSQGEQEVSESKVWVRGDYDPSTKKYEIYKFSNVTSSRFVKGDTDAFLDFIF